MSILVTVANRNHHSPIVQCLSNIELWKAFLNTTCANARGEGGSRMAKEIDWPSWESSILLTKSLGKAQSTQTQSIKNSLKMTLFICPAICNNDDNKIAATHREVKKMLKALKDEGMQPEEMHLHLSTFSTFSDLPKEMHKLYHM